MSINEKSHIIRRDIGLTGAIIVIAQVLSSFKSTHSVSSEIDKLRGEIQEVQANQEKYFVKKQELKKVVIKLDNMNTELIKINKLLKSKALEGELI